MYLYKYGVGVTIPIPIVKRGIADLATTADWTPAAGDSQISKDNGAFANTGTLIAFSQALGSSRGGGTWSLVLSAAEMQAAIIVVEIIDAATKAIEDQTIIIQTYGNASAAMEFDLDTPTVNPGTGGIVAASFAAGAIDAAAIATDAIGSAELAASAVTEIAAPILALLPAALVGGRIDASVGAMAANVITAAAAAADFSTEVDLAILTALATVQADTDDIQTRLPAALVGGRMDSSTGAMAAGVVTAAAVATGAIDADALAADAGTELAAAILAATVTEVSAVPGASPTLSDLLSWLYCRARDKELVDRNTGLAKVHNSAGTIIGTASVTDAGGVTTRGKYA